MTTTPRKRLVQPDAKLIRALGGPTEVAKWITVERNRPMSRANVSQMRVKGVPFRHRFALVAMARQKGVPVPEGFIPDDVLADIRAAGV